MIIDIERLRDDLKTEVEGVFFVGGFEGAIFEVEEIEKATSEELIEFAYEKGIDLGKYEV